MNDLKKCLDCGIIKDSTEFYKQKMKTKTKEYYRLTSYCKDCLKKRQNKWVKNNPEKVKENNKKGAKKPKTLKRKLQLRKNTQKRLKNGKHKKWQEENKELLQQYNNKRQNKNHNITKLEWNQCKLYFDNSCAYCGITETEAKEKYKQFLHREHVKHNGSNDLSNCVPACKSCNSKKWEYKLEEWFNENNPYYTKEKYNKIIKWITEDYKLIKR